jgi:acetyl-CoA carboxylase carboxyltransferase component
MPDMGDLLADLARRREEALAMGGPERVARQHDAGRHTVRERIAHLVDRDSFYELGLHAQPERPEARPAPGDAIVTGLARIDGRKVCLVGIDATVLAGTTAPVNMRKQGRMAEWAGERGLPLVCLSDADGGRIPDVMGWRFSGLPFDFRSFLGPPPGRPAVPRVVAALGPSFGDAALHAAAAHFVVMTEDAALALSGPPVVRSAIGEEIDAGTLGGPAVAAVDTGAAHAVAPGEDRALAAIRSFLSYLPSCSTQPAPAAEPRVPARDPQELLRFVPTDPKRGYDMRRVLDAIFDEGSLFSWGERWGESAIAALARIEGEPLGVVASQPLRRAGVLDDRALAKVLAFVELCDTFNLPLVFLHDVPGLMIGGDAERRGILAAYERAAARLARARVPCVSVVLRKSYGGGHFAMGGRPTRPDLLVCWPSAELGFMAPETGVRTVHRRRLEEALERGGEEARDALLAELVAEWTGEAEPWEAAAHGYVDDVIDPRDTREVIRLGIDFAWGSRPRVAHPT